MCNVCIDVCFDVMFWMYVLNVTLNVTLCITVCVTVCVNVCFNVGFDVFFKANSLDCFVVSCCCFRHACVAPLFWEVQHGSMNHDSCRHAALLSKMAKHTHEQNNNKTRRDNKTRHANRLVLYCELHKDHHFLVCI